jgi:hypothetical protein
MSTSLKIDDEYKLKKRTYYVTFGCDPEFFLKLDNKFVGAEKLIPKQGLGSTRFYNPSTVIIDGVQAELNPQPSTCRESLTYAMRNCFISLQEHLNNTKTKRSVKVDLNPSIKISEEEFEQLSDKSKKLGCAPSLNVHGTGGSKLTEIDDLKTLDRSAGGHIHLGISYFTISSKEEGLSPYTKLYNKDNELKEGIEERLKALVTLLDIFVGNTCVLIDRDPGNIKRRELYGRAGEYRLPKHGLEYRVLSNFWLHSFPLVSLVMGLARNCVEIINHPSWEDNMKKILKKIDLKDIEDAINNNDYDLAKKNFKKAIIFLLSISEKGGRSPISENNLREFIYFVNVVNQNGLKAFWPHEDLLKYWTEPLKNPIGFQGFNAFLKRDVAAMMEKDRKQLKSLHKKLKDFYNVQPENRVTRKTLEEIIKIF